MSEDSITVLLNFNQSIVISTGTVIISMLILLNR